MLTNEPLMKNSNKFDIARRFFKLYSSILALLKLKFYGFEIGFEVGFEIGFEIEFEIGFKIRFEIGSKIAHFGHLINKLTFKSKYSVCKY